MYKPIAAGGTLALTGSALALQLSWLALALFVLGGVAMTLHRFGPRIAIEPIWQEGGKYRFRLTKNGQPWRRH
jgi:hypothetical protein